MNFTAKYITPDIKLSCYEDKFLKSDISFDQHMLIWFISGKTKIVHAHTTELFSGGDIFLIPRNQLSTIIIYPSDGSPHKSVVMHLSGDFLKNFYSGISVSRNIAVSNGIRRFGNHPLLAGCMASLLPYFEMNSVPENIAQLKLTEAVSILRAIDVTIDALLSNLEPPGKIDLSTYMEKNFMFNLPLEKFSYHTGRSLSTFKRDFQIAFNTSPQKWLTRKRLEFAHYQLKEKHVRPVDVCYEAGFENLSHFSHAFKKHFGYPPAALRPKVIALPDE